MLNNMDGQHRQKLIENAIDGAAVTSSVSNIKTTVLPNLNYLPPWQKELILRGKTKLVNIIEGNIPESNLHAFQPLETAELKRVDTRLLGKVDGLKLSVNNCQIVRTVAATGATTDRPTKKMAAAVSANTNSIVPEYGVSGNIDGVEFDSALTTGHNIRVNRMQQEKIPQPPPMPMMQACAESGNRRFGGERPVPARRNIITKRYDREQQHPPQQPPLQTPSSIRVHAGCSDSSENCSSNNRNCTGLSDGKMEHTTNTIGSSSTGVVGIVETSNSGSKDGVNTDTTGGKTNRLHQETALDVVDQSGTPRNVYSANTKKYRSDDDGHDDDDDAGIGTTGGGSSWWECGSGKMSGIGASTNVSTSGGGGDGDDSVSGGGGGDDSGGIGSSSSSGGGGSSSVVAATTAAVISEQALQSQLHAGLDVKHIKTELSSTVTPSCNIGSVVAVESRIDKPQPQTNLPVGFIQKSLIKEEGAAKNKDIPDSFLTNLANYQAERHSTFVEPLSSSSNQNCPKITYFIRSSPLTSNFSDISTIRTTSAEQLQSTNFGVRIGGNKIASKADDIKASTTTNSVTNNKSLPVDKFTKPCFIKNPSLNKTTSAVIKKYQFSSGGDQKPKTKNITLSTSISFDSSLLSIKPDDLKMVAAQEQEDAFDFDPSEELQYGPGIVSKLRCRYLSLALRQAVSKQRPSLDLLRRATSLNNLLDDDDGSRSHHYVSGRNSATPVSNRQIFQKAQSFVPCSGNYSNNITTSTSVAGNVGANKVQPQSPDDFVARFQKNLKISDKDKFRSHDMHRASESLKRARSVEALLSCDNKSDWESEAHHPVRLLSNYNGAEKQCKGESINSGSVLQKYDLTAFTSANDVTIEDKILNARDRIHSNEKPPKRRAPFMDESERPPQDLVKQTLKIFEATANRRGRGLGRNNLGGEVAAKVANYKSIISQEKPRIAYPKPPYSPKKAQPAVDRLKANTVEPIVERKAPIATTNGNSTSIAYSQEEQSRSPMTCLTKNFQHLNLNISQEAQHPISEDSPPQSQSIASSPVSSSIKKPNDLFSTYRISSEFDAMTPSPTIPRKPAKITSFDTSMNNSTGLLPRNTLETSDNANRNNTEARVTKSALENVSKAGTAITQEFPFNRINNNKSAYSDQTGGNDVLSIESENPPDDCTDTSLSVVEPSIRFSYSETIVKQTESLVPASAVLVAGSRLSMRNTENDNIHSGPIPFVTADNDHTLSECGHSLNELLNSDNFNNEDVPQMVLLVPEKPALTSREIEKNLINEKKNEEANLVGLGPTDSTTTIPKWQFSKKKTRKQLPSQPNENNSMVFNFKDRKEIPDYIENDGLLFRSRRELPKPNEPGFVLLGDLSPLQTSTDAEDLLFMGPPSPCDVEFENANIIIDGRSSLRDNSKSANFSVHFDDSLTTTFEYPSETYLVENTASDITENIERIEIDNTECIPITNTTRSQGQKLLGSMTLGKFYQDIVGFCETKYFLGKKQSKKPPAKFARSFRRIFELVSANARPLQSSAPLGSYTPIKAQINTNFELGVTRAPSSTGADDIYQNLNSIKSSSINNGGEQTNSIIGTTGQMDALNNTNGNNSNGGNLLGNNDISTEPESLQFLRPATEDLTVVYSEGTEKTDLLY